ncbi:hypothetical protein ELE36_07665 [Pseudolysobacter antarcticus]|uniref:DUF4085 family protein n=1 Tax=Pseudolysobacter antarcticus TaxID=2511995 RepID=A0A411HI97_9GAMM|nr:hypothetical protein [Pseudolysobacter antarcticus]QBB70249.1 hypothetical protein ELE36_07665 [Pseudolysobacter antarcticus]
MKYFTSEWWGSGCEGADGVFEKYQRYIDSVKDRLPKAALDFNANHTLHDSEVKLIVNDFQKREARLTFHGWDTAFEKKTCYRLTFSNVVLFEQCYPQADYFDTELGDLGYWEWEVVPEGIELRMLFVSSATFRLVFNDFSFKHEALQA